MNENEVIDTNVVEIKFDNSQFVENVSQTIDIVNELKDSLQFDSNSFDSLEKATRNIDLSGITTSLESLSQRFSTFGIIGMTAIQRITNEVMTLAGRLGRVLAKPWQQIITGGTNRAANIAQAQFQLEGLFGKTDEGLAKLNMTMKASSDEIEKMTGMTSDMIVAMNAADYAVADTAYGLDSAAKAASVLATSGVDVLHFSEDLKDANGLLRTEMQVALRSISGTAAMANASYDEIAHVFERISGNGRVMAIDLQSLSARGLNAAATLRDYLNEIGVTTNATEKDIRDMVSDAKIDFMTFAKAMDSTYGDHAKDANNTFTGAFSNMKFALSKIGADFIGPLRDKMIPILNDVRISINQVRKALNFKIKFPGVEKEASIVELFVNAITRLTQKAHDFFTVWHGGQNVLEQALSTLASFNDSTGGFSFFKKLFDDVEKGTVPVSTAIYHMTNTIMQSGNDVGKVYKTLAETMDKTEDEIVEMCNNGEISLDQFSNAISATFGNTVAETRISQLANLLKNLLSTAINLANGVTSIVGPVIEAFFDVFLKGRGMNGIVGITQAISDFTEKLRLSVPAQRNLVKIFTTVFKVLRTGIVIIGKLAGGVFKIIGAFSPLIEVLIGFAEVIATILGYIIDFIADSQILTKVIKVLTTALTYAGKVITLVLVTVVSIVGVAIRTIGEVFKFLGDKIKEIDLSRIYEMIQALKKLVAVFLSGGIIPILQKAITSFIAAIGLFFMGVASAFASLRTTMVGAITKIKSTGTDLINAFSNLGQKIQDVFMSVYNFIKQRFLTLASVVAIIESLLAFGVLYNTLKVGSAITRAVTSWANKNNAAALSMAADAIKKLAVSFAIFAAGIVILSLVPTEKVLNTIGILMAVALAIMGVSFAVKRIMDGVAAMRQSAQQIKPWEKAVLSLTDTLNRAITTISNEIGRFLKNIGRAAVFTSLALLIISIAASMYILYKAVIAWGNIDPDIMASGFANMGQVLASVAAAVAILGVACKGAGGGLFGAAFALLAITGALVLLKNVIIEYSHLNLQMSDRLYYMALLRVGAAMLAMSVAVGIMGASCKKAGFGLIGAALNMMTFLIVLNTMKDTIAEYSKFDTKEFFWSLAKATSVLLVFAGAIFLITRSLGDVERGFSASLRGGLHYDSSKKQGLMGVMLSLLAMTAVLSAFASAAKKLEQTNVWATIAAFGVLIGSLGMIVLVINAMKGSNGSSVKGLAGLLISLTLMISAMSIIDPIRALSAASALTMVLYTLGHAIDQISDFSFNDSNQNRKTINQMIKMLTALTISLAVLGSANWSSMLSGAASMSLVLGSLIAMTRFMKNTTVNEGTLKSIIEILGSAMVVVFLLSKIPVADPAGLMALTLSLSVVSIVAAVVTKILSQFANVNTANAESFAIVAGMMSMILVSFGKAARIAENYGGGTSYLALAGAVSILSLVASSIVFFLNKIQATQSVWKNYAVFSAIMGTIAAFGMLCAVITRIGDVNDTNRIMYGLVMAMTGLMPFLLITMSVLSVLKVTPEFFLGVAGFTMLMGLVGTFGMFLAYIGTIGDVTNTVTIMESLVKTMNGLIPFLATFSLVVSLLGLLGPMIMIGNAMFALLLVSIAGFAALIATFAMIGDVSNTVTLMESLSECLDSLTNTMLKIIVVGALGIPAIAGVGILEVMIVSLLGLFTIIGLMQGIQNAVISGIGLIVFACESIRNITEMMLGISLDGIMIFLTAIQLLSEVDLIGLTKLTFITSGLVVASAPLVVLGGMKKAIDAGLDAARNVMTTLVDIYSMAKGLGNMSADTIIKATNDTLKIADSMTEYASLYTVSGYAHGLFDDRAYSILKTGAVGMASIIDKEFRDIMGIHSDSDWGIDMGHWTASGDATGMTDLFSQNLLTSATEQMAGFVNDQGIVSFANAGANSATSYLKSLVSTLSIGGSQLNLYDIATSTSTAGKAGWYDTGKKANSRKNTNNNMREAQAARDNFIQNFRSYDEYLAYQRKIEEEAKEENESLDYGNAFTNLLKELEGSLSNLGDISNLTSGSLDSLGSSMGGVGTSASSAAKDTDELTQKIDDLMDKYEDMWEDAKTNANKDLFKGVDKQGDEFLDSIQDIMDQYTNIYKSAVERTNNQDLFAEVKEDDESFAPDTLLNNLEDQVDQINELNTIISSLGGRIADNNLRAAISNMDVGDLPELRAMFRMSDSQLSEYEKLYQKKVQGNQNKIQNELTGSLSQITGQYTNIAEYVATDASTNMLIKNLQSQIDQLNEYNATVGSLMNRISDMNLREAIAHMGVESLDELKMLNSMTDSQLDQYIAMYNDKIGREAQVLRNELSTELSALMKTPIDIGEFYAMYTGKMSELSGMIAEDSATKEAGATAGSALVSGVGSGMNSEDAKASAISTGRNITSNISTGISEEDSIAKVTESTQTLIDKVFELLEGTYQQFKETGGKCIQKMCQGFDYARKSREYQDCVFDIVETFQSHMSMKMDMFKLIGMMIVQGMISGINEKADLVSGAAARVAGNAIKSAKEILKVKSPSREFMEIGRYVDEGFAIGLREYSNLAEDASSDMATGTLSPVQEAIQQLSGMLDGSIDINPVITPTLDLSQINARSAALANMFNGRQIAVQARADEQQAEMMTQLGNILAEQNSEPRTVTFNQTNNSPKALSRTEIYRQTRNGFSQLVSALS